MTDPTDESPRRVTSALIESEEDLQRGPYRASRRARDVRLFRAEVVHPRNGLLTAVLFARTPGHAEQTVRARFGADRVEITIREVVLDVDHCEVGWTPAVPHRVTNLERFASAYAATGSTTAAKAAIGGGK